MCSNFEGNCPIIKTWTNKRKRREEVEGFSYQSVKPLSLSKNLDISVSEESI